MQAIWGDIWKHTTVKGQTNACDFAFIQAGNLRPHTQWREAKQMQPMGLYTYKGRRFKESFENTTMTHSGQKP